MLTQRHLFVLVFSASLCSVATCEPLGNSGDAEAVWRRTRNVIAGLSSGMSLVLAGHPFDTIKVRLQTQGAQARFAGPLDCLRQTIRHEGVLGLYKGVTPPLATVGITQSILFGLQSMAVDLMKGKDGANRPPTVLETMKAAVLSGLAISVLVQPVDAVKARLQVQYAGAATAYTGPIDCLRSILAKLGVRNGLYRGWVMSALVRSCMFAYFGTYELLRKQFGMTAGSKGNRSTLESLGVSVLCGSLTGVSYWTCCYPFDVVRNRILVAPDTSPPLYRNGLHCAREIYRIHGYHGFLAGYTTCLLRSVPANAAAFLAYELSMHLLPPR